jgi:GNAT superfamily N-acetyltransferase
MAIQVLEETVAALDGYRSVPISFRVTSRFRVEADLRLLEEAVPSYVKDYDTIMDEGAHPWARRWDLSNWGVLGAYEEQQRIGGAVIAWNTPGVDLLQGRRDLAVLWDLRVHPDYWRQGVGAKLFAHAAAWARERHCRRLVVETQNVNVAACRFYERQGCYLGEVHPFVYQDFPDEVQLLWHKEL